MVILAGFSLTLPPSNGQASASEASPLSFASGATGLGCATVNTVGTISVISPASASGIVGSEVELEGSGFSTVGDVFIYFYPPSGTVDKEVTYVASGTAEPFEVTVPVPDGFLSDTLGVSEFWALDSASNCASAAFTITAVPPSTLNCAAFGSARIAVESPSSASGPAGTEVTLFVNGFYPEGATNFWWANLTGSSPTEVGSNDLGETTYTIFVNVPSAYSGGSYVPGTYLFWGVDGVGDCAGAVFTLTAVSAASLAVAPSEGPVSLTVTATGTGFALDSGISFTIDGGAVAYPSSCSTDNTGSFPGTSGTACAFMVPTGTPAGDDGGLNVIATDASADSAAATFTVLVPSLSITGPTVGPVGGPTTVTGTGFTPGEPLSFLDLQETTSPFNQGPVACSGGTPVADSSEDFTCNFPIPPLPSGGSYAVYALDTADVYVISPNSITVTPGLTITPTGGPEYVTVTANGTGFAADTAVAFSIDGVSVADPSSCLTDSTGNFPGTSGTACTFEVPAGLPAGDDGGLNVQSSDTYGDYAFATFYLATLIPTVAVSLGPSEISLQESTTVSVTVSGTGPTPTGSVSISDGLSKTSDSCVINVLDTFGFGSCDLQPTHVGHLTVTATYSGDENYTSGVGTALLVVTGLDLTISPNSGSQDETLDVILGGFTPPSSSTLHVHFKPTGTTSGGSGITVDSVTIAGPSSIAVQITIDLHATVRADLVSVSWVTGTSPSLSYHSFQFGSFYVTSLALTVSPASGSQDETLDVVLGGFTPPTATLHVEIGAYKYGVRVDSYAITGLSSITVQVTITRHATIQADGVSVWWMTTNTAGFQVHHTLRFGDFHVTAFAVTMSPTSGSRGETLYVVLGGFTVSPTWSDMTVTFGDATSEISVGTVTITGYSSIVVEITIASNAPLRLDDVRIVESVAGGPGTLTQLTIVAFEVTS